MDSPKNVGGRALGIATLLVLALFLLQQQGVLLTLGFSNGTNWRNVTVDARVNITDARPEILSVRVDTNITLNAGTTKLVQCNATIRDWNGGSTISNVSARYYDSVVANYSSADDRNDHYTNASCTQNVTYGSFNELANFTCNFTVWYHANPGTNTWVCNVTVTDSHVFNASVNGSQVNLSTTSTIYSYYALNVTPLIDYGNMAVGDTSSSIQANVTNLGNTNINISVKGYGNVTNDGLAFVCQVGNITVDNEKFGLNSSADYTDPQFTALSSNYQAIPGLTVLQQTNDSQQVVNNTYWKLYVPPNPYGLCNGTVIFQAGSV